MKKTRIHTLLNMSNLHTLKLEIIKDNTYLFQNFGASFGVSSFYYDLTNNGSIMDIERSLNVLIEEYEDMTKIKTKTKYLSLLIEGILEKLKLSKEKIDMFNVQNIA